MWRSHNMSNFLELLTQFNKACQGHDWTYMYSDDHRAYTRGYTMSANINRMKKELILQGFEDKVNEIMKKYSPEGV